MTTPPPVLLASSSVYRRELLGRLLTAFDWRSPAVDESAGPHETPAALAARLAALKASTLASEFPDHIVIGSDQVPALNDRVLRKPGDREGAIAQLGACAGRTVVFLTAVAVLAPDGRVADYVDRTVVKFRPLTAGQIDRYLTAEQPFDCAGSFKAEGLGISLFEYIESQDPTALQGLPLIWLADCLNRFGIPLP